MSRPYKYRLINGNLCRCYDIGCPDFERAAQNRKMVKDKRYTYGYTQAEVAVTKTPLGQALASWIPTGELPFIAREVWKELSGVHLEDLDTKGMIVVGDILTRYLGDVV
jgi:hypothetical protein